METHIKQKNKCPFGKVVILVTLFMFLFSLSNSALASAGSGDVPTLTAALQGLLDIIQGTTGKLLATLAIAGVGFFWLAGKISLKQAAYIGLGIGVIFGAAQIVSLLGVN